MSISRRGLFGVLASLPVAAPAVVCAAMREPALPPLIAVGEPVEPDYRLMASRMRAGMIDPPMIAAEDMPPDLMDMNRRIARIEMLMRHGDFHAYWNREV